MKMTTPLAGIAMVKISVPTTTISRRRVRFYYILVLRMWLRFAAGTDWSGHTVCEGGRETGLMVTMMSVTTRKVMG